MRNGSSLLELIVAIVVMGIAVMALPLMLTQTQSNLEFAMEQEAILATRTKIGDILTYEWDENSLQNDRSAVLVTTGDAELNVEVNTTQRAGHVNADKRRKFFPNLATSSTVLGADGGDLDDIDDFHNDVQTLFANTEAANTGFDYKFSNLSLMPTVVYVSDAYANYGDNNITNFVLGTANAGTQTNIKMVEVNATNPALNASNFVLRAYSCNIGESELLKREGAW